MSQQNTGLLITLMGVAVTFIGLLVWAGWLSWFGHLPGDLRVEKTTVRFYFPITSMLIISVALNVLIYIFRKLF
jgi:hypothetical protein